MDFQFTRMSPWSYPIISQNILWYSIIFHDTWLYYIFHVSYVWWHLRVKWSANQAFMARAFPVDHNAFLVADVLMPIPTNFPLAEAFHFATGQSSWITQLVKSYLSVSFLSLNPTFNVRSHTAPIPEAGLLFTTTEMLILGVNPIVGVCQFTCLGQCRIWYWLVVSSIFYFPFHIWDDPSHWRIHIFQDG